MAFSLKGTGSASTANSTTANQATPTFTTSTTAGAVGDLAVLIYALDNDQTTDGDEVAVTGIGVNDSAGNRWVKAVEFTNGQGASQAGATCGIWYSNLRFALPVGGTITLPLNVAASRDATAISLTYFTKAAGFDAKVEGTATLANDAAAAGSLSVTTANIACLRVRGIASESNTVTALTPTASFAIVTQAIADTTVLLTSMAVRGEWIINTGTGTASAPTAGAGAVDNASVYVAFSEVLIVVPTTQWSTPSSLTRSSRGPLGVARIASGLFAPVFTPTATQPKTDWLTPLSTPVPKPRLVTATNSPFTAATTAGVMDWFTPLSTPVRAKPLLHPSLQDATTDIYLVTAEVVTMDKWANGLSVPNRAKQRAIADYAFAPLAISEVVTIDKWFNPLGPPQNAKRGLNTALQVAYTTEYFPDTANANAGQWFGSLADPVRIQSRFSAIQASYTIGYNPDTFGRWFNPLSEPTRTKQRLAPDQSWVPFVTTETVTVDKWFKQFVDLVRAKHPADDRYVGENSWEAVAASMEWFTPLSEPVLVKRKLHPSLQDVTTKVYPVAAETVTVDKWFDSLSEPVRVKSRFSPHQQGYTSGYAPLEFVRWYQPWSEPVRQRQGLSATNQQAAAYVSPVAIVTPAESWFASFTDPVRKIPAAQKVNLFPFTAAAVAETVTVDKWFDPFSEPLRTKPGLRAALQPVSTQDTVFIPNPSRYMEGWYGWLSEPVRQKAGLRASLQAPYCNSYVNTAVEVITVDKWFKQFADPVRKKIPTDDRYLGENDWEAVATSMEWFVPLTEPIRIKSGLISANQTAFFAPSTVVAAEIVTVDKWYAALSDPKRFRSALHVSLQQTIAQDTVFIPNPSRYMEGWFGGLAEPVRRRVAPQPDLTTGPLTTTEVVSLDKWYAAFSEPKRFRPAVPTSLQTIGSPASEVVSLDKWYAAFSLPVRQKIGLSAAQQPTTVWSLITTEVVTVDKWFTSLSDPTRRKPEDRDRYSGENEWTAIAASMKWFAPLNEPVRQKIGLAVSQQQTLAYAGFTAPEVVTVDKWFKSYAEPIRVPARLVTSAQQAFFYGTLNPAITFGYYSWLAEPVRQKKGLGAHLQSTTTQDPKLFPNPVRFLEGWYNWLSEPVRKLPQLNTALQRAGWFPEIKAVQATITGTMVASEINGDVAIFAIRVLPYNPPASAVVSLVEIGHGASLTSIVEEGDDGSGTSVVEN